MEKYRIFSLFAGLLFALSMANCSGSSEPHIGQWVNPNPTTEGIEYLTLNKDHTALVRLSEVVLGGDNFSPVDDQGFEVKIKITYQIDYEKDPAWIDFTMYPVEIRFTGAAENYPPEQKQMLEEMVLAQGHQNPFHSNFKGIIRFVSDNQMELQGSEVSRPTTFDPDSEDYALFNRTK